MWHGALTLISLSRALSVAVISRLSWLFIELFLLWIFLARMKRVFVDHQIETWGLLCHLVGAWGLVDFARFPLLLLGTRIVIIIYEELVLDDWGLILTLIAKFLTFGWNEAWDRRFALLFQFLHFLFQIFGWACFRFYIEQIAFAFKIGGTVFNKGRLESNFYTIERASVKGVREL